MHELNPRLAIAIDDVIAAHPFDTVEGRSVGCVCTERIECIGEIRTDDVFDIRQRIYAHRRIAGNLGLVGAKAELGIAEDCRYPGGRRPVIRVVEIAEGGADAAIDLVVAGTADEGIGAVTPFDLIVAVTAKQDIVTVAADQVVVTSPAAQRIVSGTTGQVIGLRSANERVVASAAVGDNRPVAERAVERVVAVAAEELDRAVGNAGTAEVLGQRDLIVAAFAVDPERLDGPYTQRFRFAGIGKCDIEPVGRSLRNGDRIRAGRADDLQQVIAVLPWIDWLLSPENQRISSSPSPPRMMSLDGLIVLLKAHP